MMKIYSMFILITYKLALAGEENCNIPNEAVYISVPSTKGKMQLHLCPAESGEEINNSETDSTQDNVLKYCLYKEMFPQDEVYLCKDNVKPVFYMTKEGNKPVRCGSGKHKLLHQFGYYYCQKLHEEKLQFIKNSELTLINDVLVRNTMMYEVCYDISKNETIWTKHVMRNIFINEYTILDESHCPKGISVYPYYQSSKEHFLKLQKDYKHEKEHPTAIFPIIPQYLVPPEHFSLRTWKKTTNHYINTAPLCEILVPLMTAIDEGIKMASWKVFFKNEDPDTPSQGLVIYTRVKSSLSFGDHLLKRFFKGDRFEPSIWYKFVYDPVKEQGVMIYLHNTYPTKIRKKHNEVKCDFKNWTDDKNIQKTISLQLLENYAYCGKVTSKDIKKIFSIDVKIRNKVLDINALA